MKKWILGVVLTVIVIVVIAVYLYEWQPQSQSGQELFQTQCSRCHVTPKPQDLPRDVWANRVLPDMGARLGIRDASYNPYANISLEEQLTIKNAGIYPDQPLISQEEWLSLRNYILELAPDSVAFFAHPEIIPGVSDMFDTVEVKQQKSQRPLTTFVQYRNDAGGLLVGNGYGEFWNIKNKGERVALGKYDSPVVGFTAFEDRKYLIEIGIMYPNDRQLGKLWDVSGENRTLIQDQLRRPVYVEASDLDGNGQEELIVCEFGNQVGQLSLLHKESGAWVKKTLLPVPGTIRVELADMNHDGRNDIVVVCAQGNEGIFILYQKEDFEFDVKQVIRLSSVYGTSDFELMDVDKDGDLDIAIANGDNADFSPILKGYHGFRLFTNNGKDEFEQTYFYRIDGATQVEAADFDQDGDLDFVLSSFFADFESHPEASIVYLENQPASTGHFRPSILKGGNEGRWIVMDAADIDHDGDVDLMLGSFSYAPTKTPAALVDKWVHDNVDVLILTNKLK